MRLKSPRERAALAAEIRRRGKGFIASTRAAAFRTCVAKDERDVEAQIAQGAGDEKMMIGVGVTESTKQKNQDVAAGRHGGNAGLTRSRARSGNGSAQRRELRMPIVNGGSEPGLP